jgi:ribosomal protein L9
MKPTERPTPETDAAIYLIEIVDVGQSECVQPEFGRKLERQRDEAREERDKAIERQLISEANIVEHEKLFGHVPHDQLLEAMKESVSKLAKCREALENIAACAETNARHNSESDEAIALNHIADTAGEILDQTK